MKRTLRLLLTMVLLLSMSACSGSENGAPTDKSVRVTMSTSEPSDDTQGTTEGAVSGDTTITHTEPVPNTTTPSTEGNTLTTPPTTEPKPANPKPTEPTPTEPAPTQPKPTEPQLQDWRTAYLDFLENAKEYHSAFALEYVDGDDIPELYLNGNDEATGDAICTYKNGEVIEQRLNRTWGGSYIPREGLVKNTNGNMGYYTTEIYRLTDSGFVVIWNGLEEHELVPPANENDEPTFVITYSIGNQTVGESEYYAAIEAEYDTVRAMDFHKNAIPYDAVRQQILNNG